MHDVELLCETGEEQALLERRVAAADDREIRPLEERTVADRAVRDAAAVVLLLADDPKLRRLAADGDDHGIRRQLGPILEGHDLAIALGANAFHRLVSLDLETEFDRVVGHLLGEVRAGDRLEAGIVLDQVGVEDLASGSLRVEKENLHVGARRVQPRSEAGGSAADDDEVEIGHVRGILHRALPD